MRLTRDLGLLLAAIWLILTGAIALFGLNFPNLNLLMALLALASGAIILLESSNALKWTKWTKTKRTQRALGMILLGVWLVLSGLFTLTGLNFSGQALVMGLLALLAGLFILLDR